MSTHHLALTTAILLVANAGMTLGEKREKKPKKPWTSEKSIAVMLRVPYLVFLIWLLVRVA